LSNIYKIKIMSQKFIISEDEKSRILGLYDIKLNENSVIQEAYSQTVYDAQLKLKPKYGYLLGKGGKNRDGVDGLSGPSTTKAIKYFQTDNGITPTGKLDTETKKKLGLKASSQGSKDVKTQVKPEKGFVIPFAFPTYEPKVDGEGFWADFTAEVASFFAGSDEEGTYGKLGHGGVATVESNGNVKVFEFGRYAGAKKGYGIVIPKSLGKIAKIQDGKIINIGPLMTSIKSRTEGKGPTLPMEYAVLDAPNIKKGIQYAESIKEKEYSAIDFSISDEDANCGTFAIEVVDASGVGQGRFCATTPVGMINGFKKYASISGQV
jgi:hypothetical protein